RARLSRRALRWALEGIVCQHLTVARVAEGLGVSWNTANDAVLAEGRGGCDGWVHRFQDRHQRGTARRGPVMDPFHVVRLAGDALDQCRRRVQQATCGHRGRKRDPLYAARRSVPTVLREVITLGRTLKRRAVDVLAYFDRPGT